MANRAKRRKTDVPPVAPSLAPVPEVVALLEQLTADAKAGKIRAIGTACVLAEHPFTSSASIGPQDLMSAKLLKVAVIDLWHEFSHALRGR